jgi:hypothetical protein
VTSLDDLLTLFWSAMTLIIKAIDVAVRWPIQEKHADRR